MQLGQEAARGLCWHLLCEEHGVAGQVMRGEQATHVPDHDLKQGRCAAPARGAAGISAAFSAASLHKLPPS